MNKKLLLQIVLAAGAAAPIPELPAAVAALEEPAFVEPQMPVIRQVGKNKPAAMPVVRFTDKTVPMPMPVLGAKAESPAFPEDRLREVFDGARTKK
jgi:hypothetical protein